MGSFKPDKYQKAFCEDAEKSIRLLAPAGSGKTQSLLLRCRHMANNPDGQKRRFLIFTFTKVASNELKDRLKSDFQDVSSQVEIITLNAWGWRRLGKMWHSRQLIKTKGKKKNAKNALNNTLQPVWKKQKYELLNELIRSKKGDRFVRELFEIIDGFKIFGFRHDMNKEAYFNHCKWLMERGLDKHFDAIVIKKLKGNGIIDDNVDDGDKRLSIEEKNLYFALAWIEVNGGDKLPPKREIYNILKERFSEKLAEKVSNMHSSWKPVFKDEERLDEKNLDEIDELKKKYPRIYKRWEFTNNDDCEKGTDFEQSTEQVYETFFSFWKEAIEKLKSENWTTFSGQKYWPLIDLESNIKNNKYSIGQNRYTDIMVDEFQDINLLDLNFLKVIAKYNKTGLIIVGDDDQAIFEWRGATPDFIVKPDIHISDNHMKTHIFENNYRSAKNIVAISQKLIKNNKNRVEKNIRAVSAESAEINVKKIARMQESIDFVLEEIENKDKTDSIALIGRKKGQIIPYQIVFASREIKFYAAEDLQLFLSDAFDGLQEILKIKDNKDNDPVKDLIFLCDKIKKFPIKKEEKQDLKSYFKKTSPTTTEDSIKLLRDYPEKLKSGDNSGNFAETVEGFYASKAVAETIDNISKNFEGFRKDYEKSQEDIFYSEPPFEHLAEYAKGYGEDYEGFVKDLQTAKETLADNPEDNDVEDDSENWKSRIHLMTALRAKGKEFDNVIVLDANDDIWPVKPAKTEGIEQERRLFYVATTRARKKLTFVVNENFGDEPAPPSPFLSEMELPLKAMNRCS